MKQGSFCTHWNRNTHKPLTKKVKIPTHPSVLVSKKIIHSRLSRAGQKIDVYEDFFGNRQVYINNKYQIGLNYDGIEPTFGDDSHEVYLEALRMHGEDISACKILIIGGGDLGLASLLIKSGAENITQYEIDEEVVEVCEKYMKSICSTAINSDKIEIKS